MKQNYNYPPPRLRDGVTRSPPRPFPLPFRLAFPPGLVAVRLAARLAASPRRGLALLGYGLALLGEAFHVLGTPQESRPWRAPGWNRNPPPPFGSVYLCKFVPKLGA